MNDYYVDYGQNVKVLFQDVLTNSGIDNAIRANMEIFPPEEKLIFAPPFIKKGEIVYDVGSYVGTHSFLFALYGTHVYSFEPSPFNYPRLVKNVTWFNTHFRSDIKCFDIAFHEKEYDVTTQFKDCNNTLPDNNDAVQFIKYWVLDKFMTDNNLPVPDFIKIDVEGMETIVFKTLHNILSNNKTIVYVERHRKPASTPDLQHYPDNPNWRFPSEGGYEFNDLKKYDVDVYNFGHKCIMNKLGTNSDWNDLDEALVIFPRSKADRVKESGVKTVIS